MSTEADLQKGLTCPRCEHDKVRLMARAPLDDAWEMYICARCDYSWRSTEPATLQDPANYDPHLKLGDHDFADMTVVIPLPES